MKRFFATLTVTTLALLSLAGCSKKTPGNSQDTTPTPTASVTSDAQTTPSVEIDEDSTQYINFGGTFVKDNANLSIYIGESGWEIVGVSIPAEKDSPSLVGLLTYTEGTTFVYSDNDNEVALTYRVAGLDITVTKGSTYKGFEGAYTRVEESGFITPPAPEETTKQELLGRIALTHYALHPLDVEKYNLDFSAADLDNDYLNNLVLTYTDMFLLRGADIYPELSETTPYYPMSKDSLNDLLLTATAGKVDLGGFTATNTIICKDDIYYIPCQCRTYGEITVNTQEASENTISLDASLSIAKEDSVDLKITLTTSENASAGSTAMQINTATFEVK